MSVELLGFNIDNYSLAISNRVDRTQLKYNKEIFVPQSKMHFVLNQSKILELLMGVQLYKDEYFFGSTFLFVFNDIPGALIIKSYSSIPFKYSSPNESSKYISSISSTLVSNNEAFLSAIHHGANAIYLGGLQFGARSQAQNFTTEEIIELIKKDCKLEKKYQTRIDKNDIFNENK